MKKGFLSLFFLFILLGIFLAPGLSRASEDSFCAVYLTGVGCPHCAKSDPIILGDLLKEYPKLTIIEYEIYQQISNAPLIYLYNESYNSGLGIPLMIFNKDDYLVGDRDINNKVRDRIEVGENSCPLSFGLVDFDDIDFNSIVGLPKIWHGNRVLIRTGVKGDSEVLKKLLEEEDIKEFLKSIKFENIEPSKIPLSGGYVEFENAIKVKDWIFQWDGDSLDSKPSSNENEGGISNILPGGVDMIDLTKGEGRITLTKVLSLAAADAVNPCALAVLALMLIAILSYNREKKRNVLLAGLAFTFSVFIMYLIYGVVIIRSFQIIQGLTWIRVWLHQILGIGAVVLGLFKIRDYFKSGAVCNTSSKVAKIVSKVTSPAGAFVVGAFVTIFLLPCTIGPYVICGGILCSLGVIRSLPLLILYNIVFVLPMIVVVFLIYFGLSRVDDISSWQARNLGRIDLVSALLIIALGVFMILNGLNLESLN